MRYKTNHRKDYNETVTYMNTPHLKENTIIIFMSYLLIGLNFAVAGFCFLQMPELSIVSIPMIFMAPISITDDRRSMRGTFAVVGSCVVYLASCAILCYFSYWWILAYVAEAILCAFIVLISIKKRIKKKVKK